MLIDCPCYGIIIVRTTHCIQELIQTLNFSRAVTFSDLAKNRFQKPVKPLLKGGQKVFQDFFHF